MLLLHVHAVNYNFVVTWLDAVAHTDTHTPWSSIETICLGNFFAVRYQKYWKRLYLNWYNFTLIQLKKCAKARGQLQLRRFVLKGMLFVLYLYSGLTFNLWHAIHQSIEYTITCLPITSSVNIYIIHTVHYCNAVKQAGWNFLMYILQIAEQLVMFNRIDEDTILQMDLNKARRDIGTVLLTNSSS